MPVVSPHRSGSSSLAGSYRSTYGSSADKPFYYSGSYAPRISSYSERFSTRSYTEPDGTRVYSRSASITEDGYTTRFREESRENSARRDSVSRDSGIGSLREGSDLRRESSASRSDLSALTESVAEFRNRYSPANYVPACQRKKESAAAANNVTRSRSINDIGLPPAVEPKKKDVSASPRLNRNAPSTASASNGRDSPLLRIYEDESEPRQTAAAGLGLNGLKNIGNTCFMNSVLQCLSNTRLLLEYVRKDGYIADINSNVSNMKGSLIKAFAQVLKELWNEDSVDRVVNTVALKSQIQRFAPRFMGYAQQDAQEFLRYLLEGLHEDVNRVTEKPRPILTEIDEKLSDAEKAAEAWRRYLRMDNSRIVDIFVGQLKSTLRCTHCGHCSVTFDPFWDLSLPIPQRTGQLRLSQCLDHFTKEETLDGDEKPTCSKCKERRRCTKSFSIQKFPKILVIHLKRFSPTERFRGKLSVTVDFPREGLDLRNYAADNPSECRYNLYAISNHSGTTYSGHYTAYCRHPYSLAWHEYNDSRVSSISPRSIVSGEAYVLFYELESQKSHL